MKSKKTIDLVKLFSLSSLFTISKILSGLIVTKIIAVYLGSSALATVGNIKNLLVGVQNLSSFGIYQGTVNLISKDKKSLNKVYNSSLFIIIISSIFFSLILIAFSKYLSNLIFYTNSYYAYIILIGVLNFITALTSLSIAVWNGLEETTPFFKIGIASSFISLIVSTVTIYLFKTEGIILALIIVPAIISVIHIVYLRKSVLKNIIITLKNLDHSVTKIIFKFSAVTIITGTFSPIKQLVTRNLLTTYHSNDTAGNWEGLNLISIQFTFLIVAFINIHFYPKISKGIDDLNTLKYNIYFTSIIITLAFFVLFHFRHLVIRLLFSEEFIVIESVLIYQLVGDFFMILSLFPIYYFLAKRKLSKYIFIEITSIVSYIAFSYTLIPNQSIFGATNSYIISSIIVFIVSYLLLLRDTNTLKKII